LSCANRIAADFQASWVGDLDLEAFVFGDGDLVNDGQIDGRVVLGIGDDDSPGEDVAVFLGEDTGLAAADGGLGVGDIDCGVDAERKGERLAGRAARE